MTRFAHAKVGRPIRPLNLSKEEETELNRKLATMITEGLDEAARLEILGYRYMGLDEFLGECPGDGREGKK